MSKSLYFLFFVITTSCCLDKDTQYLSNYEKEFIPYKLGDTLTFTHDKGLEFYLYTTEDTTELVELRHFEKCGFVLIENKTVKLESDSELSFKFTLPTHEAEESIVLDADGSLFTIYLYRNPDIDTLTLNGHLFENIYKLAGLVTDTTVMTPIELLYTKNDGIIQIVLTNNVTFTISP